MIRTRPPALWDHPPIARVQMFSSRRRSGTAGESPAPVLSEDELYGA